MSKIVKYTELKRVVNELWNKIKTNFITEVKYDSNDKKLKYTKNGQDTEITGVVTKWGDLEHTTQSSIKNIFDKNTQVEDDKHYFAGTGFIKDQNWCMAKIPCGSEKQFTVVKMAGHDSKHFAFTNEAGAIVGSLDATYQILGGKAVYKITIPSNLNDVAYFTVNMYKQLVTPDQVMVFSGHIDNNNIPTTYIPFADGADVLINSNGVALSFDGTGTNLTSATIHSAIKELNKKIVSAGGGTVTRVNGQDPDAQGEVTVGIADINGLQDTLNSKVVTVNQQQQQGGNVTLTGADINATVGNTTKSIQEFLRSIGIMANNNDTRLLKLERKHPTYNVGDIIPTFKENAPTFYTLDGCRFMHCATAQLLTVADYQEYATALGVPAGTNSFYSPVINDESVRFDNNLKTAKKRYYVCVKVL